MLAKPFKKVTLFFKWCSFPLWRPPTAFWELPHWDWLIFPYIRPMDITVFAQLFYRHYKYFMSNGCFQSHIICSIIDFRSLYGAKLLIMASVYSVELSIYITLKIFSLHQKQLPRLRLAHCQKHMDACWPIHVKRAYGIHIFKLRKKKEIKFSIIGNSEMCPCFKSLKNIHIAFK